MLVRAQRRLRAVQPQRGAPYRDRFEERAQAQYVDAIGEFLRGFALPAGAVLA